MNKMIKMTGAVMAGALLLTGCAGKTPDGPVKASPAFDYDEVAGSEIGDRSEYEAGYNSFAFSLLAGAIRSDENVMVSPASVMMAFDVVSAGAGSDTLTQLTDLFCPGADPVMQQAFASELMERINDASDVEFSCANAIWNNSAILGDRLSEDYIDYVDDTFGAGIFVEEFDDETVDRVNAWISDNTDGMIEDMLSELSPSTAMVVANAIAFEASWSSPFEESHPGTFTCANGDTADVDMLCDTLSSYYETDLATGFIKYYEGGDYAFVVMLPNDEDISANDFMQNFTAEDYEEFMASEVSGTANVLMPEFEYGSSIGLNDIIQDMGATDAFDPDLADFSGISEETDLYISRTLHNTYIEVTREGTRAAAATTITLEAGAMLIDPEQIKIIECDRPFAYAIVETSTNMPIFVGTVNNMD